MCARCDAIQEQMKDLKGKRVVVLASIDEHTILIYGHGVFDRLDLHPDQQPMTFDELMETTKWLEVADSERGRQTLRISLAMKGYSTEQIAQAESTLDEEKRKPMDQRVTEYWTNRHQVPHVMMDDGTEIWGGIDEVFMFGPEETFEEFAGNRSVVEVPYLRVEADA